jgi:uncharacterized membrane protein
MAQSTVERPGPVAAPAPSGPRWWRRPWIVPALMVSVAFVAYSLPPYLHLDPATSRIKVRPDWPLHYQLLVTHILAGTVAILTGPLQLWPWLRLRHPSAHRVVGRVYVFAGAVPASIAALLIMPVSAGPPGNAVTGLLWLACTVTGYRMIRKHRYHEHRRWMIYSVALAFTIVWGRIMFNVLPLLPRFGPQWIPLTAETATWIGLVINLGIAQWWLERTADRRIQGLPGRS